jgi:hypothetical protein
MISHLQFWLWNKLTYQHKRSLLLRNFTQEHQNYTANKQIVFRILWRKTLQKNHKTKTQFFFSFMWPCIETNFFVIKPTRCTNFTDLFFHENLHVSESSSVHHQEFIHCTLSNGICHTCLWTNFEQERMLHLFLSPTQYWLRNTYH